MYFVFFICITGLRLVLVQGDLIHTVNGVEVVVDGIDHTVFSTLQYDTAAEHTAHVCTLDGVQRATVVDIGHTKECPLTFFTTIFITKHQDIFALFYLVVFLEGFLALLPFLLLCFCNIL